MKKLKKLIIVLILISLITVLYSMYIEPRWIKVKTLNVNLNKNLNNNIKVVQFSDTQLGDFFSINQLKEVVYKINKECPDIVIFTGDLLDNASTYADINEVSGVLSKISCPLGKYAIYGNHDYGGGAVRYYNQIMNESGFKVLKNSSVSLKLSSNTIKIFGCDDKLMGSYNSEKTLKGINSKDINILALHEPDLISDFESAPIDLALAGHSHGGQVRIPFYGPLMNNTLAKKYTHGLYDLDNKNKTKFYVNTGLGNTKLPFRLGNIPEITVFNINP